MYSLTATDIIRRDDGTFIPADSKNGDYAAYLAWRAAGNTPTPYVAPVVIPYSVTPAQAKAAIYDAGLLPAAEAAVAAAPKRAQIFWADATEFTRDSPTLNALATTLGLSSAQVDALFVAAKAIEA